MTLRSLFVAVALGLCAATAFAKQGIVRTTDGRNIEGDITDNGQEGVAIKMKAGTFVLRRNEVASIIYGDNIADLYAQRLAALPPDAGAAAHVELARWLYEVRAYDLARKEVDAAIALEPNNADAAMLRQTIDRTAQWERNRNDPAQSATVRPVTPKPTAADAANNPNRKIFTTEQVNFVKHQEISIGPGVQVRLLNNVGRRFALQNGLKVDEFLKRPLIDQAREIQSSGNWEFVKDVRIMDDAPSVRDFKKLQGMILGGCATAACHGGPEGGNFTLISPSGGDPGTYTNYYILRKYSTDIAGTGHRMMNAATPELSLLVQFGLPIKDASIAHPDVKGFTPMFKGIRDPRLRQVEAWITATLGTIPKEYAVADFTVHQSAATTQPASGVTPVFVDPAQGAPTGITPQNTNPPAGGNRDPRARPQPNDPNAPPADDDRLREARERVRPGPPIQIPPPVLPF